MIVTDGESSEQLAIWRYSALFLRTLRKTDQSLPGARVIVGILLLRTWCNKFCDAAASVHGRSEFFTSWLRISCVASSGRCHQKMGDVRYSVGPSLLANSSDCRRCERCRPRASYRPV